MTNTTTAQLVPRCICMVAAATVICMMSSHLQLRIWSTISGRDRMMMPRHGAQIQKASLWWKQASKSLNGSFNRELSDSSNSLKSSESVLLVTLLNTHKEKLLMTMWICNASVITSSIYPPQTLWPIDCIPAATQRENHLCEDGMHRLDSCWKICVVSGTFSDTLQGGWMGDNSEFLGQVLGLFLVFCLLYYYIIHIPAWRAGLRVHDVRIVRWDVCFLGSA